MSLFFLRFAEICAWLNVLKGVAMNISSGEKSGGKTLCVYHGASGPSFQDCVFLGQRYREQWGDNPDDSDYWALGNRPAGPDDTTTTLLFSWKDWLTGIWRSPDGTVYVSDATIEGVHKYVDIFDVERPPEDFPLGVALEGIWGLHDKQVFTWGTRKSTSGEMEWPVFCFDGNSWTEMPMPGFPVMAMHGLTVDSVIAVGFHGSICLWNGSKWEPLASPTVEVLNSVFVVSPDEVYACGGNGSLLRGSLRDWQTVAKMPEGMSSYGVAKFKDQVYVAGGSLGLFRWEAGANELEFFKENIRATSFDTREDLVITADNLIAGTTDNLHFSGCAIDTLCKMTAEKDIIGWEDHLPPSGPEPT